MPNNLPVPVPGLKLVAEPPKSFSTRDLKYTYYVAKLLDEEDNVCGKAIFNTNPTNNGIYQLEIEIEECLTLAGTEEPT